MFRQLRWKGGLVRHYEINQSGRVRCSLDHTVDIPTRIQGGKKKYRQVQLMVGGGRIRWLYVHRLMGFSWLRIKHVSQTIVDHIDGNGLNNNLQNLRWVTPRVNNLNRKDIYGLVLEDGLYTPKIMGHTHVRYSTQDEELARLARTILLECYIRYGNKYPEKKIFPHSKIHLY